MMLGYHGHHLPFEEQPPEPDDRQQLKLEISRLRHRLHAVEAERDTARSELAHLKAQRGRRRRIR